MKTAFFGLVVWALSAGFAVADISDGQPLERLLASRDHLVVQPALARQAVGNIRIQRARMDSELVVLSVIATIRNGGCTLITTWQYSDIEIAADEEARLREIASDPIRSGDRWELASWVTPGAQIMHFRAPNRLVQRFPLASSATFSTEMTIECDRSDLSAMRVGELRQKFGLGFHFE